MARKFEIADDMFKKYGALLSISDIARYAGVSRDKARKLTVGLGYLGNGTGKRYFYKDVASRLVV